MTFLSTLWAAVLLATGGLSLIPHDLKPREPIEQQGQFHRVAPPSVTKGSGYKPTPVPSDSAWAAKPDTAWSGIGDDLHRQLMEADSLRLARETADSLVYRPRADSISLGLVDPRTFTWQEWEYQRQKAMYFYRQYNRRAVRKRHLQELNGKTDVPHDWAGNSIIQRRRLDNGCNICMV